MRIVFDSLGLMVVAMSLGCSVLCLESPLCAQTRSPLRNPPIRQGMAGIVTYTSDTFDAFGCNECGLGEAELYIFPTSSPPSEAALRELVSTTEPLVLIVTEEFAEPFDAGNYVVCGQGLNVARCSAVTVVDDQVTTVHALTGFGGTIPHAFADGDEPVVVVNVDVNLSSFGEETASD